MAELNQYRDAIQALLQEYATYSSSDDEVETELICDTLGDHYQLIHVGWLDGRRIYGCILHFDIKNEKVWLQHNGTENDVAEELVEKGVSKRDIVIGFHSPFKRQFTEYAVG